MEFDTTKLVNQGGPPSLVEPVTRGSHAAETQGRHRGHGYRAGRRRLRAGPDSGETH